MVRPLHIKNAHIWNGNGVEASNLYTTDVVVEKPPHDALVVDLEGYTIFPGLINAHDHLELNHYPRSKFREVYNNAHEWGEDMNARLDTEPYKSLRAYPLWDRLFIGGLKNLLCGATTVAHHNPPHKELFRKDFPVRVLRKYGWAHSLHFSTDEEIVASYRSTPKDVPWFIHLAEGTDEVAAGEYRRLKKLGCIGKNTVIVHGVGIRPKDIADAANSVRGLIWCPSTNFYLLGKTPNFFRTWASSSWNNGMYISVSRSMAFGSDSRLTSNGDLLDEMFMAFRVSKVAAKRFPFMGTVLPGVVDWYRVGIFHSVTSNAAHMLGLKYIGHLRTEAQADFIAIRIETSEDSEYKHFRRADLALVVKGGVPQIGDPEVMAKFPHVQTVPAILDGRPKAIHIDLAQRILKCKVKERGLEVDAPPKGRMLGFTGN